MKIENASAGNASYKRNAFIKISIKGLDEKTAEHWASVQNFLKIMVFFNIKRRH